MEEQKRPKLRYNFDDERKPEVSNQSSSVETNINKYFDTRDDYLKVDEETMFTDINLEGNPVYSNGTRIPDSVYGRKKHDYTEEEPFVQENLEVRMKQDRMLGWLTWGIISVIAIFSFTSLENMEFLGKFEATRYPFQGLMNWFASWSHIAAPVWKVLFLTGIFVGGLMLGCGVPIPYFLRKGGRVSDVEDKGIAYMVYTIIGIISVVYSIFYYEVWGGETDIVFMIPRAVLSFFIIVAFTGDLHLHKLETDRNKAIALIIIDTLMLCIVLTFVLYQVVVPLAIIAAGYYLDRTLHLSDGDRHDDW